MTAGNNIKYYSLVVCFIFYFNIGLYAQYDTASYDIQFETHDQPMWKTQGYSLDYRKQLFHESWRQKFDVDLTKSIMGEDFGLGFSAYTSGSIGMEFFLEGMTTGTLDTVAYPVTIRFMTPHAGSFNAGEKIIITSEFQVHDSARIVSTYPSTGSTGLDFHFDMQNSLSMKACLFDCASTSLSTPDINEDITIFKLSPIEGETRYPGFEDYGPPGFACYEPPTAKIPAIVQNDLLPMEILMDQDDVNPDDSIRSFSPFFAAELDLPNIEETMTSVLSNSKIQATGSDTYIKTNFDVIGTMFSYSPNYKLNNTLSAPGIGCVAALNYDLFNTNIYFDVTNKQEFTFNAKVSAIIRLPVAVEYQIKRNPNMVIESGRDSLIIYRIGDQLEFIFPCEFEFLDFQPTFKLINSFNNHTYDQYDLSVGMRALTFEIEFKKVVIIPEASFTIWIPFEGEVEITTPEVAFDPPDQKLGPAWEETFDLGSFERSWFDETWEIQDFKKIKGPPFRVHPEPFLIDLTPNHILCEGNAAGDISLSHSGATSPVSYEWSNGATTRDLNNVRAGDYYVKATDKNGCTAYQGTTIHEPDSLTMKISSDDCLCHSDATGAIYAKAEGGVPPYDYNWSNGSKTANNLNIPAGRYTLTVTDQNGCTIQKTVTIDEPAELNSYINDYGMPLCHGSNDGYIKLNATGGNEPYRFQWSNFRVTQNIDSLEAGHYSVTVNDDNGCTTTSSVTIPDPPKVEGELYVKTPISCYNGSDGAIAIDLKGGTPPYKIDWYSPEYSINESEPMISGLYEGLYQIEVLDSNNCYLKDTLYLESPEDPFYTDIEPKTPSCSYSSDGALYQTVYNGTPPYSYQWSNGRKDKDIVNLPAGEYDVTVTDNLGCRTTNNAILIAPEKLGVFAKVKQVSCLEEKDGTIKLIPYGGTPPYEVTWRNGSKGDSISNLAPGNYEATVTDSHQCTTTYPIEITVKGEGCIDIPSAFTPNNDGINDKWVIRHLDLYPNHSIQIFTKWGSLIYEAHGDGNKRPWEGKYRGKEMPAATYYYIIDLGNNEPLRKGLITIVR